MADQELNNEELNNEELILILSNYEQRIAEALGNCAKAIESLTSAMETFLKVTNLLDDRIKILEQRKFN